MKKKLKLLLPLIFGCSLILQPSLVHGEELSNSNNPEIITISNNVAPQNIDKSVGEVDEPQVPAQKPTNVTSPSSPEEISASEYSEEISEEVTEEIAKALPSEQESVKEDVTEALEATSEEVTTEVATTEEVATEKAREESVQEEAEEATEKPAEDSTVDTDEDATDTSEATSEAPTEAPTEATSEDATEDTNPSLVETLYHIIVETKNRAALDRVDYRNQAAYEEAVQQAEADVEASFQVILEKLTNLGLGLEKNFDFAASFTGFSATVNEATFNALMKLDEIEGIRLQNRFTPGESQMNNSGTLIGMDLFDLEGIPYKGENMVVSVIDTGFDFSHPDLQMGDEIEKRYDQETMEQVIQDHSLPGQWFSNKIPYGYNYADNTPLLKAYDEHGTHVAGTIGANGDPEDGGIRGIAPHVQILAMKAFSEDQQHAGVYEDVWLKAFDDSIKLGADVINMSLGGISGFNMEGTSPMQAAIERARAQGILPVIAAGNDRNSTYGVDYNNLVTNPDNGVMGYPATVDESFAIGSFDNVMQYRRYVEATYGDGQVEQFMGSFTYPEASTEYLPLINFGLGNPSDYFNYEDLFGVAPDFTGHLVLVQRGIETFDLKYNLAINHGAEGVIIYDNVPSDYPMEMTGLTNLDEAIMFIREEAGQRLIELMNTMTDLQVRISEETTGFPVLTQDNLSEFTSWGPTTDLLLKPEMSAPGGFIHSLISDEGYQDMSGTSMATPHIAGAAILVMQRLYEEGYLTRGPNGEKDPLQDDLAMLMLMNSAVTKQNTLDADASYYTPIQQGAGMLNIFNALKNDILITAVNGIDQVLDGKLELKEIGDNFDYELTVTNHGDTDASYNLEYILLGEQVDEYGRFTETTEIVQFSHLGRFDIAAGETLDISGIASTYGIDLNQYVQGYFRFVPVTDEVELSVPFFGFKGEWDMLPIIDELLDFADYNDVNYVPIEYFDEYGNWTGIDKTAFVKYREGGGWNYWPAMRIDDKNIVFVNANHEAGFENAMTPVLSFLRNAKDVFFSIETVDGEQVIQPVIVTRIKKVNQLYMNEYNYLQDIGTATWYFNNLFGDAVDQGEYVYVIEPKIDYPDARYQRYEYNIILDNDAPEFNYVRDGLSVNLDAMDNLAGIQWIEFYGVGDHWSYLGGDGFAPFTDEVSDYSFILPEFYADKPIEIFLMDYSGNRTWLLVNPDGSIYEPASGGEYYPDPDPEEPQPPVEPEVVDQQEVNPEDYVDESEIQTGEIIAISTSNPWDYQGLGERAQSLYLEGQVWNVDELHRVDYEITDTDGNVIIGTVPTTIILDQNGNYIFTADIPLDGLDENQVYAVRTTAYGLSAEGNLVKNTVSRRFRRNLEPPTIQVDQVLGQDNENYLYYEVTFADNMNYVEAWAGNSMIGRIDETWDTLEPYPVEGKVIFEIPVEYVGREIYFYARDDFGNFDPVRSEVLVQLDTVSVAPYETLEVFDPELAVGESIVIQEGVEGLRNTHAEDDVYLVDPVAQVIAYGPVEIDFTDLGDLFDPNLDLEEVILVEGVKGLMNPLNQEVLQDPVDQVAYYGPLPVFFDTIIRETDSLVQGETERLQAGVLGRMNPLTNEVYEDAIDEILLVGTKVPETQEPSQPIDPEDPSQPSESTEQSVVPVTPASVLPATGEANPMFITTIALLLCTLGIVVVAKKEI